MIALLLAQEAVAGRIIRKPLDEVIVEATVIAVATLDSVEDTSDARYRSRTCTWTVTETLKGEVPDQVTGRWSQVVPVMRDAKGKVIGSISPIVSSSGIEASLDVGTSYVVLGAAYDADSALPWTVLRVEPATRRTAVVQATK